VKGSSNRAAEARSCPERINQPDLLPGATALALAEALSAERIEDEDRQGNAVCAHVTWVSTKAVRAAIDQDRHNRKNV